MKYSLVALFCVSLSAQETIVLRPATAGEELAEQRGTGGVNDRAISNVVQPSVTVYLPPKDKATGKGILICPGGGYQHLAIDKEGHDVARWLNSIGIAGLVLKYRLPGRENMTPALGPLPQAAAAAKVALEDAEAALRLARANAAQWNLRPGEIGMMGFSAGGHLALLTALIAPPAVRPDFLVLVYPAVPKTLDIPASMPPTFIVAADDDRLVPPSDHAVRFYLALKQAQIPAEMLVYSTGGHGFGIRQTAKTSAAWPSALAAWLTELLPKAIQR
jgi:acetyl esterase/lipase